MIDRLASHHSLVLTRVMALIMVIVFCFVTTGPVFAGGISDEQRKVLLSGARYFNTEEDGCNSQSSTPTGSGLVAGSSVYILGDSITVRSEAEYKKVFAAKQITPVINASVGRSWTGGGQSGTGSVTAGGSSKPGKDAVVDDAAKIKEAKGIIIALGSNGGLPGNPIGGVIDAIKAQNPTAPIWWVNTAGTSAWKGADLTYLGGFNKSLSEQSTTKGFQVVDWFKVVNPTGDPTVSPTSDPGAILEDGLHPKPAGITSLVSLVTATASGGGTSTVGGAASSTCCASAATTLTGSDVTTQIWNFFISKGFSNIQAAGAMGNLEAESNFKPKLVEGGNWGGKKWGGESDTIPPSVGPQGQPGYGLVQWTSAGRKAGLQAAANTTGKPVYDLSVQLDFLWSELSNPPYKKAALEPLLAAQDLSSAVKAWQNHYEVGANFEPRMKAATKWLQNLGSGAPATTPATTPASANTTPAPVSSACGDAGGSGATDAIVGGTRWPLVESKAQVKSTLGKCYDEALKKICMAGHPYKAHDLFAPQGTQVVAFSKGEVISSKTGTCGHGFGDAFTVQVFDSESNTTYFYQHMDPGAKGVAKGAIVKPGDPIGKVGPTGAACNTATHLHIDASTGRGRVGCSRLSCSAENQAKFKDISSQLFLAAEALQ